MENPDPPDRSSAEIRRYRDVDEDGVVALWRRVFPHYAPHNDPLADVRRGRDAGAALFLVAVRKGRVVGTVLGGFDGHRGWAHRLAVAPEARRRGLATALMTRLESELDTLGCPKLNLQVRGDAADVVAFYRKLGYAVEDRVSLGKLLPSAPRA